MGKILLLEINVCLILDRFQTWKCELSERDIKNYKKKEEETKGTADMTCELRVRKRRKECAICQVVVNFSLSQP
jgi:hypothetical protein